MDSVSRRYHPGISTTDLEERHNNVKNSPEKLEGEMDQYKAGDDVEAFNRLVPTQNAGVRVLNDMLKELKFRSVAGQKLDLAFNRCLDPAILLGKFDTVDLTSHAAEVEGLREGVQ
jgi:hypothetical protein